MEDRKVEGTKIIKRRKKVHDVPTERLSMIPYVGFSGKMTLHNKIHSTQERSRVYAFLDALAYWAYWDSSSFLS